MPSNNANTTMFLLGAGASFEAGIPLAHGMTKEILDFRRIPHYQGQADADILTNDVINFIVAKLHGQEIQTRQRQNVFDVSVDIEQILSGLTLLRHRYSCDAAAFVSAWSSEVGEFAQRSALQSDLLTHAILTTDLSGLDAGDISQLPVIFSRISSKYFEGVNDEDTLALRQRRSGESFAEAINIVINRLSHLTWLSEPQRAFYLRPILSVLNTQEYLTVATLNYDNTLEIGVGRQQVKDAVYGWSATNPLYSPQPGDIFLLKLHGSIDWSFPRVGDDYDRTTIQFGPFHERQPATGTEYYAEAGIILGRGNKLRSDGPFLDLFFEFKKELFKSKKLIVIGYSFRDEHINVQIERWFQRDDSNKLTIISPSASSTISPAISRMQARDTSRIEFIDQGTSAGLQSLYPNFEMN